MTRDVNPKILCLISNRRIIYFFKKIFNRVSFFFRFWPAMAIARFIAWASSLSACTCIYLHARGLVPCKVDLVCSMEYSGRIAYEYT